MFIESEVSNKFKNFLFIIFFLFAIACSKDPVTEKQPAAAKAPATTELASTVTDDVERKKFRDELILLLDQENFAELERIAHAVTTRKDRFPGGDWKLSRFYESVGSTPGMPKQADRTDYGKRIVKIRKWIDQKPDSIYANIALGEAQIGYAWQLRGGGFANMVDDQEFENFHKALKEADQILNKMAGRGKECVEWFRAKQSIGTGLGWDRDEMMKLWESAVSAEPLFYTVYSGHAYYLLPRWHGKSGDWENFTVSAVTTVSKTHDKQEADILYSEICWRMSRFYSGSEFFKQNKVNWLAIKRGFKERQQRYGESIRYLNAFCNLAGSAGDKPTARALMQRIGDRWEPDFWIEKKYFDGYKKWAFE